MKEVIIVGTGISGLTSALMLAQSGIPVTMLSYHEAMRSASCMAQGGINAAELHENDSALNHFTETISSGGWIADQQAVMEMCKFAPNIIAMYDHIGVAFNRNIEGSPDTRFFGGSKFKRTHYADTTTGAQLLSALDGQVRRFEKKGLIKRFSGKDFVRVLIDEHKNCYGCIMQDIYTMKLEAYTGVAVIVATGGYTSLYGSSTSCVLSNGAVAGKLMLQGVSVANAEFVQFHPTAMAYSDKPRLISESARGEGGRLWVLRDNKPWYFLEEMYPELGNLVARDVASRTIYKVVKEMGLGIDGKNQIFLDITHLSKNTMEQKLSNVVNMYKKFSKEDPRLVPMKVYPAPHYTMGGIYVDSNHRTIINGLYACGECDYMYHGSNRLGGNSLLSATYSGFIAAKSITLDYESEKEPDINCFNIQTINAIISDCEREMKSYCDRSNHKAFGNQNIDSADSISKELGNILMDYAGIVRDNANLQIGLNKIQELKERQSKVVPLDKSSWANSSVIAIRKLRPCIIMAETIITSALARNESRGAHFKPEFPERDDKNWLKTTIASFDDKNNQINISYKTVDTSLLSPFDESNDLK